MAVGAVVLALGLSACGSDDDGAPAATDSGQEAPAEITIGYGTPNTANAPMYIAKHLGYFEDENLDVTLQSSMNSTVQALSAGQVDLVWGGLTAAAIPASQGKQTKVLYGTSGNGVTIWTVGVPGVNSVADCERLGSFPKGSSTYAWSEILKEGFGSDAEIVPIDQAPARVAAMESGQLDCANGSASGIEPLVERGTAQWLVRPDQPGTLPPNMPHALTEVGIFGMENDVEEMRPALVRFIRAIHKGSEFLLNQPAAETAALLKKDPDFGSFDEAALARAIDLERSNMIPNNGRIEADAWPGFLDWLNKAALDLDTNAPALSYEKLVDMSIYNEAVGQS